MTQTYSKAWQDYQLIDAGDNKKLERWGKIISIRPDRNAYFSPVMPHSEWRKQAHFEFIEKTANSGSWQTLKSDMPHQWQINFNDIVINLHLTKFKHLGIFPEQRVNWDFIDSRTNSGDRFLNLFGYTGVASLVARNRGAQVYHCDSVRQIIHWAKQNMESSGLTDIHWIVEDALKFAQREVKRGRKYQGIIMDPPAFGIGAKKQRWKIENKFPELLQAALELRAPGGYIIASTYSPRLDENKIRQIARDLLSGEQCEVSTLSIMTQTNKRLDFGQRTLIKD